MKGVNKVKSVSSVARVKVLKQRTNKSITKLPICSLYRAIMEMNRVNKGEENKGEQRKPVNMWVSQVQKVKKV